MTNNNLKIQKKKSTAHVLRKNDGTGWKVLLIDGHTLLENRHCTPQHRGMTGRGEEAGIEGSEMERMDGKSDCLFRGFSGGVSHGRRNLFRLPPPSLHHDHRRSRDRTPITVSP